MAREVNDRSRSLGVALTSCTVPAAGKPTFDLADNEIEMGIGIHGEPGRSRVPLASAHNLAAAALDADASNGVPLSARAERMAVASLVGSPCPPMCM